jgi:hypothetical protein
VVARPDEDRDPRACVPWEARRAKAPPGLDPALRKARAEAKILLQVARARLGLGEVPPADLAPHLAGAAQDPRLSPRTRLRAAELLGRIRVCALRASRTSTAGS